MPKMKAKIDFEDQDGKFSAGDEFEVNDERALVLSREGKADRLAPSGSVIGSASLTTDGVRTSDE